MYEEVIKRLKSRAKVAGISSRLDSFIINKFLARKRIPNWCDELKIENEAMYESYSLTSDGKWYVHNATGPIIV